MTTLPSCPTPCDESNRAAPGPCQAQLHRYPTGRGAGHLGFYCVACRRYPRAFASSPWYSLRALGLSKAEALALPIVPHARPARCQVCGATGAVQVHHLAPSNVFGVEADSWPTVNVCLDCHAHWHRMMDGYRTTAPRCEYPLPEAVLYQVRYAVLLWSRPGISAAERLAVDHIMRELSSPFRRFYATIQYVYEAGVEYGRKGYAR